LHFRADRRRKGCWENAIEGDEKRCWTVCGMDSAGVLPAARKQSTFVAFLEIRIMTCFRTVLCAAGLATVIGLLAVGSAHAGTISATGAAFYDEFNGTALDGTQYADW